jgi:UPF0716 protein FxsA
MPLLGFVLLFLELTLLILFGRGVGFGVAFLEIILTGVLGVSLMFRVGRKSFQPAQFVGLFLHAGKHALSTRDPMEWFMFGCLLLIIPGLLTDLLGAIFMVRFILHGGALWSPRTKQDSIEVEFDVRDDDS